MRRGRAKIGDRSELQRLRRGDAGRVLHRAARHRHRRVSGGHRCRCTGCGTSAPTPITATRPTARARDAMIAKGYAAEGYGPDSASRCARRAPASGDSRSRVTAPSPFAPGCDGVAATGTLYAGAEVEPYVAINPHEPDAPDRRLAAGSLVQRRRARAAHRRIRSTAAARGRARGARSRAAPAATRRTAATIARASDPWVTFAPDGTAYQIALAFNGETFAAGLVERRAREPLDRRRAHVERSGDADPRRRASSSTTRNRSPPIRPTPRYVYATWDRLTQQRRRPDVVRAHDRRRRSWEPARPIYDPARTQPDAQQPIVVVPNAATARCSTSSPSSTTSATRRRVAPRA